MKTEASKALNQSADDDDEEEEAWEDALEEVEEIEMKYEDDKPWSRKRKVKTVDSSQDPRKMSRPASVQPTTIQPTCAQPARVSPTPSNRHASNHFAPNHLAE
ncbi:hypothetical protein BG003_008161 [Podila horticola]|nr:hypothetical protein BG003_008161 [Podila horticola]